MSPSYLEGQTILIVGDETPAAWNARAMMDELSDNGRPLPVIGWVTCNLSRTFSPGWSRRGEPYLLINIERERERSGSVRAFWGSYAAHQSVGESERAAMQPLFEATLFDRMRYGDVELKIWRTCWIPMWKEVVSDREREFAGFLLGTVQRTSSAITVEICQSMVVRSGNDISVVLTREDHAACQRKAGASGLCVVGWWHSHPAQGITMSRLDDKKHFELFPPEEGAHSVAVVVMPHARRQSMRAGVFLPIPRTIVPAIGAELARLVPPPGSTDADEPADPKDDWGIAILPPDARPAGRTLLIDGLIAGLIEAPTVRARPARSTRRAAKNSRLVLLLPALLVVLSVVALLRSTAVRGALGAAWERVRRTAAPPAPRPRGLQGPVAMSPLPSASSAPPPQSRPSAHSPSSPKPAPARHHGDATGGHTNKSVKEKDPNCCTVRKEETAGSDKIASNEPPARLQLIRCELVNGHGMAVPDSSLADESASLADYRLRCDKDADVVAANCCHAELFNASLKVREKLLAILKNDRSWNALVSAWRLGRECHGGHAAPKKSPPLLALWEDAVLVLKCSAEEQNPAGD